MSGGFFGETPLVSREWGFFVCVVMRVCSGPVFGGGGKMGDRKWGGGGKGRGEKGLTRKGDFVRFVICLGGF